VLIPSWSGWSGTPRPPDPTGSPPEEPIFTYSNAAALINYAATFAVALLMSLYSSTSGPGARGGRVDPLPPAAGTGDLLAVAGRMSDRIEPAVLASCGMMVSAVSLLGWRFSRRSHPWRW